MLKLKPDMVLFYHEFNDSLPTSLRNKNNVMNFLSLTDMQLYRMKNYLGGVLYYLNKSELNKFIKKNINQLRFYLINKDMRGKNRNELLKLKQTNRLKMRVPIEDRKIVFKKLLEITKKNNIQLVIIHPTYKRSINGHNCFLKYFAKINKVPLIETSVSFKNSGYSPKELFHDNMHPTEIGHSLIAEDIYKQLKTIL